MPMPMPGTPGGPFFDASDLSMSNAPAGSASRSMSNVPSCPVSNPFVMDANAIPVIPAIPAIPAVPSLIPAVPVIPAVLNANTVPACNVDNEQRVDNSVLEKLVGQMDSLSLAVAGIQRQKTQSMAALKIPPTRGPVDHSHPIDMPKCFIPWFSA
ncbi:uncharacterized protein BDCG_17696 [Blastomyces dermatitidis ER-3]|uniref:Uncharacterized protein n=1 Tax=Ajellomyces dermatitidis (strain ER-3 / ATCC MYA-2586) TaxID=559297 RepID=A0ABP2ENZ2_AJEDR|nr:uncharacterized protein BDCG_17696 [Blastomyces dermatitidis ER-3]EEQ84674.2 hypothetical protein BDCG_17696 [Blastomyces dermatitidis ER-3]